MIQLTSNVAELSAVPIKAAEEWRQNDEAVLSQFKCRKCLDSTSGFYYDANRKLVRCDCRLKRLRIERFHQAIERTPKQFAWITDGLQSIVPNADVHPKQPAMLANLKSANSFDYPDGDSFYLFGRTGAHKTTLAFALMQEAGRRGMKTYYEVGRSLVDVIRHHQNTGEITRNADGQEKPFYSLAQLESNERICVLIDEIEDTASSMTPFTMSILFGLFEKCQAFKHQILITSNVSLDALLARWIQRDTDGKADAENYARKIHRRIGETCLDIDLT